MKVFFSLSRRIFLLLPFFIFSNPLFAEMRSSITQWEFTWTFDRDYECGQFVNGDWWVVGPVSVVSVSPGPRRALDSEKTDFGKNVWGDSGMQNDSSKRCGSMIVMKPSNKQGYDSRIVNFDPGSSIDFPYLLKANTSLITSISNDTIPQQVLFHKLMWPGEKSAITALKTAAILTCLDQVPPADAFRPCYVGDSKRLLRLSEVNWENLLSLPPTESMPSWSEIERYFERPWLDHINGNWLGQKLWPTSLNQPAYGRENARLISIASLMLLTDAPKAQKEKLLIRILQIGIDLKGIADLGGNWNQGGGHTSGRKWPIIFASLMFEDPSFLDLPQTAVFHEDTESYYGKGWAGQAALWQIVMHHGARAPYMHVDPKDWPNHDVEGGRSWAQVSEGYRLCCNSRAWTGQALAALLMKGKSAWDHNAYFDLVDDYLRKEDLYAENRPPEFPRPDWEGSASYYGTDNFVSEMWYTYRESVPEQENGSLNQMWDSYAHQWVPNEILMKPGDLLVKAGERSTLNIQTLMKGGKVKLTMEGAQLPRFCKLEDLGNGEGILKISPAKKDVGEYKLVLKAVSKSFTESAQEVLVVVSK